MNNNFIVLRSNYDPTTGNLYIVDGSKFEELNQHDCYGSYGQPISAYDAGDYSPANSASTFMDDMISELSERFGDLSELSYEGSDDDEFSASDFELDGETVHGELGEAIEQYCMDNVVFATYDHAMNYWDGNNWQTIYYDQGTMDCPPYEKLSDKDSAPILAAFDVLESSDYEQTSPGYHQAHRNGYTFVTSQFENDNWMYAEVSRD